MQTMQLVVLVIAALSCGLVSALYGPKSDVINANDKNFKEEVLNANGIVIVEFYAPWCGHCKTLAPEYEKAASVLKGVVKVVAVDATESPKLQAKYGIQGFPSLKVFGQDKKKPEDYNGQRTADGIISETMKSANKLVKDRKKGNNPQEKSKAPKAGASKTPPVQKKTAESGGKRSSGGGSAGGSNVVELTEANFNALVMDSTEHWLVEFYAPWCGHCKSLEPEWESAAKQLKGSVMLGKVDSTVHGSLAQAYGVKGYPSIKIFEAGMKTVQSVKDYNGPRESAGIVDHALQTLEATGAPMKINELTSQGMLNDACVVGKICAVAFLPHIYDSSAKTRSAYISTISDVAKSFRGSPLTFFWVQGGSQENLENGLQINNAYPTMAVFSLDRKVFAVQKVSWSGKNVGAFLNGVISGSERTAALTVTSFDIKKTKQWDGKDSSPPVEEPMFADDEKVEL